jgi:hypothetical protein
MQLAGSSYETSAELDGLGNPSWLDEWMTDIPNLQDIDIGQLLDDRSQQNLPAYHFR